MKKKHYFIDFSTWVLEAKDMDTAWEKAKKMLDKGYVPQLSGSDNAEDHEGELIECYKEPKEEK